MNAGLPALQIVNGEPRATSLAIAGHFGREHRNVLKAIRSLECSAEFTALNFERSDYVDPTGRKLPMFTMTRDGFAILVMGFTGREAMAWKERYIAAFNAMEAAVRSGRDAAAANADDDPPLDPLDLREVDVWTRLLTECRRIHGTAAAAALWRRLPLPQIELRFIGDGAVPAAFAAFLRQRLIADPAAVTANAAIAQAWLGHPPDLQQAAQVGRWLRRCGMTTKKARVRDQSGQVLACTIGWRLTAPPEGAD